MNKSQTGKKSTPKAVQRYIIPAVFILLMIAMIVVFAVTFLSMAGLTPGA
jgi:hypothetical protein